MVGFEQLRQMPKYRNSIISKAFPYEIIMPYKKIVICEDHYLLKVKYRLVKHGKIRQGVFKIFDDGNILPAIVPAREWNFAFGDF